MFRLLKNGQFVPHANISSGLNVEEIRKNATRFAINFSNQVCETGTVRIEHQLTKEDLAAIVEIMIHELIYYHQIGEIACFLATSFADAEKDDALDPDTPQPDTPQSASSQEADCGFLCRSSSGDAPVDQAPMIGQLATDLLTASGEIRKKITGLFMEMAMPNEFFMLGPAGYSNFNDAVQQQYYHGRLVHVMMIRLTGKIEIQCGMTPNQILAQIADIAKLSWTFMDMCSKCDAFRFAQSASPLFNTIQMNPMESIFGNWKQPSPPQQWESDDVPSHAPEQLESDDDVPSSSTPNTYAGYVLDYDSSGWDEFDEDQRRRGGYDHAEEAS
jgi:hypothetical protein